MFKKTLFLLILFLHILFSGFLKSDTSEYIYGSQKTSHNIFGETGIIVIPNAKTGTEGDLYFSYTNTDFFKYGALVISPFNWLEASYFYYRPKDIYWGTLKGKNLDKGFSVKASKQINKYYSVAVGLSDFAGTGYFTREYLLATFEDSRLRLTAGLGFGKFSYQYGFKNPFAVLFKELEYRSFESSNYKQGGSPSYDQWFRGDAAFIGGAEFKLWGLMRGATLKVDYDPFDYFNNFSVKGYFGQELSLRDKDSHINFGLNIPISKSFKLAINYIKGNTLAISFNFGGNFNKSFFSKKDKPLQIIQTYKGENNELNFHEDLLENLKRKEIYLQSSDIDSKTLKVAVSSTKFRDPIKTHSVVGSVAHRINDAKDTDLEEVMTIQINVGNELNRITTPIDYFRIDQDVSIELASKESSLAAGNQYEYQKFEFRPTVKFPASYTGIAPILVNHIGDPRKFYYGGLVLKLKNELQFSRKLMLNTEIHQNLINNFDEKTNTPDSDLPHVRTDVVSYLQQSETYISRMQLDYFFNPRKELFAKFSAGILENMYSGAGTEFLYKPFEKNYSLGFEVYRVQKRAFNRRFGLLEYRSSTGHINFNYYLPASGILGTISYGKYLAGDLGFTIDISRRLQSGFRAGLFFTRTNVSSELFGEGSFDKGFYFQIPIDLFLNDYRGGYINFKLRPLTRDGGQKLEAGNDLIGIMHTTSRAEIERDWSSFND